MTRGRSSENARNAPGAPMAGGSGRGAEVWHAACFLSWHNPRHEEPEMKMMMNITETHRRVALLCLLSFIAMC